MFKLDYNHTLNLVQKDFIRIAIIKAQHLFLCIVIRNKIAILEAWLFLLEILLVLVMLMTLMINKAGYLKWKLKNKELFYINENAFKNNLLFIAIIYGDLISELNNLMAYQQAVHFSL